SSCVFWESLTHPLQIGELPLASFNVAREQRTREIRKSGAKGGSAWLLFCRSCRIKSISTTKRPALWARRLTRLAWVFRTPDSLPWSVKSLPSALLKRQRRASAIRLACGVPDYPIWDTTGKRFRRGPFVRCRSQVASEKWVLPGPEILGFRGRPPAFKFLRKPQRWL